MGCCLSHSTGADSSDYPSDHPGTTANASSSRAINTPSPSLPHADTAAHPHPAAARRHHRRDQGPLDQHINKPLRRHAWTSESFTWTKGQLAVERADFFDTRVTGRPEIWQTIHATLQLLWEPVSPDTPRDDDDADANAVDAGSALATAQTILSAAEISLPTGDLVNGAYDAIGNLYSLPEWVVSDPTNVVQDEPIQAKAEMSTAGADDDLTVDAVDVGDDDPERRREEKGKGVIDVREQMSLHARLSETGRDITMSMGKSESVRSVARRIAEDTALAPPKRVRIAYMGKLLTDNASLEAQGWQPGHVVNAFVFDR